MKGLVVTAILAAIVAGCATKSSEVPATYMPASNYRSYDCIELEMEARRVSSRAQVVAQQQDANRSSDQLKTTVGVILFWPIILANDGDGQITAELANLKGQKLAIEEASKQKGCNIAFTS